MGDSKNTFIVGEITKEDGTKIYTMINFKWLRGGHCVWPPYMSPDNVKEAIVVFGIPDETWKLIPFRGLNFFGLYELARQNLITMGNPVEKSLPTPTATTERKKGLLGDKPSEFNEMMDVQFNSSSKNEEEILRTLRKQEAEISALRKEVADLKAAVSVKNDLMPLMTVVTTLPISSVEQMKNFNEILSVKDVFEKVVKVLQKTKSTNANDIVVTLMTKAIAKNVAKSYDWTGKNGRKSFLELKNFIKLITAVAQHQHKNLTETEVRGDMQKWLKKNGEEVQ